MSVIPIMNYMSILIVFLVHHLFYFLKETLTVPKIKDLVKIPQDRYKKMYETIHNKNNFTNQTSTSIDYLDETNTNQLSTISLKENMKNELKQFMKMQVLNFPSMPPELNGKSTIIN